MKLIHASLALALASCAQGPDTLPTSPMEPNVTERSFGQTADGRDTTAYTLTNASGWTAVITDFGATLVSLNVPDRDGKLADVVLGFDDVSGYEGEGNQYFGCIAGRVANRIANAKFRLKDRMHRLAANNGEHTLHGGEVGFGQKLWEGHVNSGASVTFHYASPSGEEGFPGRLDSEVTYELTDDGELVLRYEAFTDVTTLCNLTHHSYFNLGGHGSPTIADHELMIAASEYTPADDTLIPTGELAPVAGTPFDFQTAGRIGTDLDDVIATPALGYDHNYVLDPRERIAAELHDPASGRTMQIETDQPGLQFYSGNFLFGQTGKGGTVYPLRSACCLETQAFPAAPSHDHFPSIVLHPGERYTQTTIHRFSVR